MNYYNVSTKEALEAGRMKLKYIPMALVYPGGWALYAAVYQRLFLDELEWNPFSMFDNLFFVFLVFLAGLGLSVAWRSFHSAVWKIWVLENVQDAHRVYQLAVSEGMIYERFSWSNTLEYRTHDQKISLEELEKRLDGPRQMEVERTINTAAGDQSIPYSPFTPITYVVISLFFLVYIFNREPSQFGISVYFYLIFLIPAGIVLVRWLPRFLKPAPLRFNNKELTVKDEPPVAWTSITDIRIEQRQEIRYRTTYLVVEITGEGPIELNIDQLKGSAVEIEDTLYQYWTLAKQQSKPNA